MFSRFIPTLALILLSTAWGFESPKQAFLNKAAQKVVKIKPVDDQIRNSSVLDTKPITIPRRPKLAAPNAGTKQVFGLAKTDSASSAGGPPVAFSLTPSPEKSSDASVGKPKFKPVPGESSGGYFGGPQFGNSATNQSGGNKFKPIPGN